ncbi:MAG: phosphoribosylamine--glycine ligase, partial [Planctomycetota bacterium]|nr:phosphoribosylamine--glycine ligase [Planctomycetota bacterium]
ALVQGKTIIPLESSQDHKPAYDGDRGPNTGGMGAYSPTPLITAELMDTIIADVLVPTVHALNRSGRDFCGILYAGLMITGQTPKVLEFNVRFGDPETQPVLMRLKTDLLDVIDAVIDGKLESVDLEYDARPACCVVLASENYPGKSSLGLPISGLEPQELDSEVQVFHAGTALRGDEVVTAGGRVLGVTALGDTLEAARSRAYEVVEGISFNGARFRRDIAG